MDGNKIIGKNVIGGLAPADNRDLGRKETQAIDFIRKVASQKPSLFMGYSGGKDSEVLLHLMHKARIDFTPYFNQTTVDFPYTLSWVQRKGNVMIMRPQRDFFALMRSRGLPNTFQRWCCERLKERFVAKNVFFGIRADESPRRRRQNPEPEKCVTVMGYRKARIYMPILFWSIADLAEYIKEEQIQCHPFYYDSQGQFCPHRRLGCMCCPLPNDRGIKDFHQWPRMIRIWTRNLAIYRLTRPTLTKTISYYEDEYENMYCHLNKIDVKMLPELRQSGDWKPRQWLEETFKIQLSEPQSTLEAIRKNLSRSNSA